MSSAVPVGRGAKLCAAVHAATLAELAEGGYTALSIDKVAQRAGVHKTSVYRRWSTREGLVLDALTTRNEQNVPIPDTGTLSEDLYTLANRVIATVQSPHGRALLSALLSDAARVPEIGHTLRGFFADRFARGEPVIERAIARGEIPADTDPEEALKTLIAPIYLRLTITGETLDAETARRAVAVTVAAAEAGALRRRADQPAG